MAFWDYAIMFVFCLVILAIGLAFHKKGSKDSAAFFLAGRKLPWWLAGASILATDFGPDTPLHMSSVARRGGIISCWYYFRQALTQLSQAIVFAKYWRRSRVVTDIQFYELRHGGPGARVLRGFLGCYSSLFFTPLRVCIFITGMQKICVVLFNLENNQSFHLSGLGNIPTAWAITIGLTIIALVYTAASGLLGVVWTELLEFVVAIIGTYVVFFYALHRVGGLDGMHEGLVSALGSARAVADHFQFFPGRAIFFSFPMLFLLFGNWWLTEYVDGKEFQAQKMLACRTERDASMTFLLAIMGTFVVRSWPWFITGIISLLIFPALADPELAYPMMVRELLPQGLLGLLFIGFFAAFLSSIDALFNLGATYFVNDVYRRFFVKGASERHYVRMARVGTLYVALMGVLIASLGQGILWLLMLVAKLGAGYGMFKILRWFWWRVNSWAELAAIISGFVWTLASTIPKQFLKLSTPADWIIEKSQMYEGTVFTKDIVYFSVDFTIVCVLTIITTFAVMFLTPPDNIENLKKFFRRVRPAGPGWKHVHALCPEVHVTDKISRDVIGYIIALLFAFSGIFAAGSLLLGHWISALILFAVCLLTGWVLRQVVLRHMDSPLIAAESEEADC